MKDWLMSAASEGLGRGIASILLMPITLPLAYLMVHWLLWVGRQWTEVPDLTNGQVLLLAMAVTIFGR